MVYSSIFSTSSAQVEAGTRLVDRAGATMEEVVTSIRRVTDIMGEITTATQEQSSGIEQVNQAIGQMDEATQQNAALVEESAAAAAAMQEQAARLAEVVSVFKVEQAPAPATVTRTAPRQTAAESGARKPVARLAQPAVSATKPAANATRAKVASVGADEEWEQF